MDPGCGACRDDLGHGCRCHPELQPGANHCPQPACAASQPSLVEATANPGPAPTSHRPDLLQIDPQPWEQRTGAEGGDCVQTLVSTGGQISTARSSGISSQPSWAPLASEAAIVRRRAVMPRKPGSVGLASSTTSSGHRGRTQLEVQASRPGSEPHLGPGGIRPGNAKGFRQLCQTTVLSPQHAARQPG